ncbi:PREDICTED: tryptase gamma-like [Nicrophorus vespilloides]|uniref:Tryptase gamma-like n=1 Tax=Nicrophorus vespilloides TaxID=110193 RepID=A0ABM1MGT7_NICVS|nr:PREDICTED: tryptase gamma-like [Nicrophorus vespilloides]
MSIAVITSVMIAVFCGLGLGYNFDEHYGKPGFPVLPPPRTTRQTTGGGGFICVSPANCNNPNNTNVIDPRIVTPGTAQPTTCPAGQVECACGTRYIPVVDEVAGATKQGAFPWQAYLEFNGRYNGSGVLVDPTHVVTAAHKVFPYMTTPQAITVKMGVWNNPTGPNVQMSTVRAIRIHPGYQAKIPTLMDDIAILQLTTPIVLGKSPSVGAACLPSADISQYIGRRCLVAGWGVTSFGANDAPTMNQKQVQVPIVDYNTCRTSMMQGHVLGTNTDRFLDTGNREICAGGEANRDACTQDGGSPLVCQGSADGVFRVVGLVIWGKNCGQPNVYGVYVSVPAYLTWIRATIAAL